MHRLLQLCCLSLLIGALAPAAASAQAPNGTPPTASTRAANPVGSDTATVNGVVNPNGQATSYRFEYGTTTAYGLQTSATSAGAGTSPVSVAAALSALTPDTVYHFRVVAWPDSDPTATVVGNDRAFHTIASPGVSSNSVRGTGPTSTTLDGKVDPNGSPTQVFFEWGPTRSYGQQTPPVDIGRGRSRIEVTAPIGGLTPHTIYHYRVVATNAAGTGRGGDRGFTTARQPTGITLAQSVLSLGFGGVTSIDGQVQGVGVDHIRVALESTPFPFTAPFTTAAASVRAQADGSFHLLSLPLQISTRLRVVTVTNPPVVSPDVTVLSRLLVGASALRRGPARYRITGLVTPSVSGARVSVQRRVRGKWVRAKRTRTRKLGRGRVGYEVTVPRARKARHYRAVVRPRSGAYTLTASRSVTVPGLPRKRR